MITTPRRPWSKRVAVLLTAAALALPVTATVPAAAAPAPSAVVAAPSAPTAAGCSGTRIVAKPIKLHGHKIAWLYVYYNRSTDTKCALTRHAGASWGKWAYTQVRIWNASSSSSVGGDYRYRTGPASIGNADGVCVAARGSIDWRGATRTATVVDICD